MQLLQSPRRIRTDLTLTKSANEQPSKKRENDNGKKRRNELAREITQAAQLKVKA
jgi:hypothetical protein